LTKRDAYKFPLFVVLRFALNQGITLGANASRENA
jgi:hypothetical protein